MAYITFFCFAEKAADNCCYRYWTYFCYSEEVNEMPTHTAGVHIFKPPVQPTAVDKTCTTEIAYKPLTTGPTKLCFKPG